MQLTGALWATLAWAGRYVKGAVRSAEPRPRAGSRLRLRPEAVGARLAPRQGGCPASLPALLGLARASGRDSWNGTSGCRSCAAGRRVAYGVKPGGSDTTRHHQLLREGLGAGAAHGGEH